MSEFLERFTRHEDATIFGVFERALAETRMRKVVFGFVHTDL